VADDLGREAVAGVTGNSGRCHPARLPGSAAPRKRPTAKLTVPGEVAELQANREGWAMAGMLGKLERCGPKLRPCIRVDERDGSFGDHADYRVILGY